ncbi:hypothetical protein [Iningainema tapete]|uniref:Uncharacterized protein n=1 Tax=Iningainema tapete BLCC-T55 TaxID=2748662 RepID=A0A8J6XR80_9CYAN|nr:hypothetical protein [Iningainema tapete]MBD2775087.1 hypothetical protein [Iningainema tapete BLCC-T55]
MSIWLLIALVSYLLGAAVQWLQLRHKVSEFDEYTNFPIVWAAQLVTRLDCFLQALIWPYVLILESDR